MLKQIKILFFVKGSVPTPSDQLEASEISGALVCFRNVDYVESMDEKCDGVAGAVPDCYASMPTAKQAMAAQRAALQAMQKKLGETAAPKPKTPEKPPEQPAGANPNPPAKPPAWNANPNPPA